LGLFSRQTTLRRCLTENAQRGKREVTDNAPLTQSPDGAGYPRLAWPSPGQETMRPTGRSARGTNDAWVLLPKRVKFIVTGCAKKKSDPSKPWVETALPVRISRSALAPNVPHADLYVTPLHNLLIDGVLAPAEILINGTTITRYEAREYNELEYFHIKLESHDVIYAEGAPAETLFSVNESAVNFADYLRQYGTPTKEETPCAPVIHIHGRSEEFKFHGRREELKSRFRSALSPWIDLRNEADVVRDRIEEGGVMLSRQAELTS
jgi:hypothetical protein